MTAPFYQIKCIFGEMFIEYTTSDRDAMDRFLGNEKEPPCKSSLGETKDTVLENLKEAFKGRGNK